MIPVLGCTRIQGPRLGSKVIPHTMHHRPPKIQPLSSKTIPKRIKPRHLILNSWVKVYNNTIITRPEMPPRAYPLNFGGVMEYNGGIARYYDLAPTARQNQNCERIS